MATRLLSEAHLKVGCPAVSAYSATIPVGQVLNWSYDNKLNPVSAPYGATILVAVSKGPPPVPIPADLAGGSFSAAQSALVALGFTVTQAQESSTQYPSGQVTRTVPAAGVAAPVGSAVTVYVSTGPPIVSIPERLGGHGGPGHRRARAARTGRRSGVRPAGGQGLHLPIPWPVSSCRRASRSTSTPSEP